MYSMTGFGHAEGSFGDIQVSMDVKSVNSRYLDFKLHLGREWLELEPLMKKEIEARLARGRVDVFADIQSTSPDLLVLNMAIVPSAGTAELARTLGVPLSSEGFFMEAHLKMRPMDFMAEGVFVAGMAHYPKFIEETIAHAQATAGRAITILAKQPLYIGGSVAVVDQSKCVGCLTCVRSCPFGIPQIQPEQAGVGGIIGAASIDPALCQGCGTCTGECPAKAIQLLNYTDQQILAQGLGAWAVV
ncbi:MAG: 4Fe-4S binding protein [Acidobacteriota bacterium]